MCENSTRHAAIYSVCVRVYTANKASVPCFCARRRVRGSAAPERVRRAPDWAERGAGALLGRLADRALQAEPLPLLSLCSVAHSQASSIPHSDLHASPMHSSLRIRILVQALVMWWLINVCIDWLRCMYTDDWVSMYRFKTLNKLPYCVRHASPMSTTSTTLACAYAYLFNAFT